MDLAERPRRMPPSRPYVAWTSPALARGTNSLRTRLGFAPSPLANCEELNCATPSAWASARLSIKCSAVGNLMSIIVYRPPCCLSELIQYEAIIVEYQA